MSKHILIVEDEVEVAKSVGRFLQQAGFGVSHIERGDEVEAFCKLNQVDMILLDVMLPGLDGMQVCSQLRRSSDVPIFMLTACSEESQRLSGLELGADDYICKPFSAPELVMRVRNFFKRFDKIKPSKGLVIDKSENTVAYQDSLIRLTKSEIELVSVLQKHPNQAFSRDQILDSIYRDFRAVSDRTVDTHIKNVRKKLKDISPSHEFIQAVYGVGYRYVVDAA